MFRVDDDVQVLKIYTKMSRTGNHYHVFSIDRMHVAHVPSVPVLVHTYHQYRYSYIHMSTDTRIHHDELTSSA